MTRKQKRISMILGGLGVLGLAAGLVLYALSDTITFFHERVSRTVAIFSLSTYRLAYSSRSRSRSSAPGAEERTQRLPL